MRTPTDGDNLDFMLEAAGLGEELRAMIRQFTLEEFRRGYLLGKREMKMAAENAIAGLRVEEA